MKVKYSIVDVFTNRRFAGNPLAVIHDGSGLSTEQMQQITTEFGFSESSFICPPKDNDTNAEVRIFTPHEEIPFAGHPNIGTAFIVANNECAAEYDGGDKLLFDEKGGIVDVTLRGKSAATIIAPQTLVVIGECDPTLMAQCLGLAPEKIIASSTFPCVATVGLPFAFVQINSVDDLGSITLNLAAFEKAAEIGPKTVAEFCICAFTVTNQGGNEISVRSRVISPIGSPVEDPATGSASGALGALLTKKYDKAPYTINITQGVEMGRRSEITVHLPQSDSAPHISGECVLVSEGVLHLS